MSFLFLIVLNEAQRIVPKDSIPGLIEQKNQGDFRAGV